MLCVCIREHLSIPYSLLLCSLSGAFALQKEGLICCTGQYENKSREELLAGFLLAYHQSEGGPWSLKPDLWLDRSMKRNLHLFIQARKAGDGESACWHVVRHLLKIRDICRDIIKRKAQCSVLGRQAAMMFLGKFDENLQLPSSLLDRAPSLMASASPDDNTQQAAQGARTDAAGEDLGTEEPSAGPLKKGPSIMFFALHCHSP